MPPRHPKVCTHCNSFLQILQYRHKYFCIECEGLVPLNRHRTKDKKRISKLSRERYRAHFAFSKSVIEGALAA